MPQTYSSGVPARGCEVSLISLEWCSRLATVASEGNEGSSMIGRPRRPHKRTTGREPQKNYLWSRGGSLFGTETSRSAFSQKSVLRTRVPLWLSPHFISSMHQIAHCSRPHRHFSCGVCPLLAPHEERVSPQKRPNRLHNPRLLIQAPCTSAFAPAPPPFRLASCALHTHTHSTPQHWLLCHLG